MHIFNSIIYFIKIYIKIFKKRLTIEMKRITIKLYKIKIIDKNI